MRPESPLLSFGYNFLDELCGGVYTRQLTVLYGEKVCQTIAEQLCVRAQLPIEIGGLNAKSVFIDGGNTFDIYHVSNYAATLHLDRDEVLHGINISRAFTCYQLVNLIVEKLPELLCEQKVGLVVISNLLDLFMDSEVDLKETKHTVNFLSNFLTQFARENGIALVITCSAHEDHDDAFLRQFLTSRAQIVLKAERRGRKTTFALEKHPLKQRAARVIMVPVLGVL
jgi:RecA/RadA recombinase